MVSGPVCITRCTNPPLPRSLSSGATLPNKSTHPKTLSPNPSPNRLRLGRGAVHAAAPPCWMVSIYYRLRLMTIFAMILDNLTKNALRFHNLPPPWGGPGRGFPNHADLCRESSSSGEGRRSRRQNRGNRAPRYTHSGPRPRSSYSRRAKICFVSRWANSSKSILSTSRLTLTTNAR